MKAAVYEEFQGAVEIRTVDLECAAIALRDPGELQVAGVTVIDRF